jgi:hypothetical protein
MERALASLPLPEPGRSVDALADLVERSAK